VNVRLRRLQADYDAVRRLVRKHPRVTIEGVIGNPPEKYRIVLRVASLRERGEQIERVAEHRLEITLPQGYPRDAPICRMLTPVFHPNIAPHAVCIGDHWTAGESLDLMIQRVGEMLAYQSYNIKSPLNGRAAQWATEHLAELPIDREEFFLDLATDESGPVPLVERAACSNCGAASVLEPCGAGHQLCADCVVRCAAGKHILCLACGTKTCACTASARCANCGGETGGGTPCPAGHPTCGDCVVHCTRCGNRLCFVCKTFQACPRCKTGT
jgi:hypothetical protein